MLRRFLFRWHKTILSAILWLCLVALWVRSSTNSDDDEDLRHRNFHARHQRRISHVNELVRFDQQRPEDLTRSVHEGAAHESRFVPVLSRKTSRNSRNNRFDPTDFRIDSNKDNPVVDIQIESKSYLNFDTGDNLDSHGQGDNALIVHKDVDDIDVEEEHLELDSINQQVILAKVRGDESVNAFNKSPYRQSDLGVELPSNQGDNTIIRERSSKSPSSSLRQRKPSLADGYLSDLSNINNRVIVEPPSRREPQRQAPRSRKGESLQQQTYLSQQEYLRQQESFKPQGTLREEDGLLHQSSRQQEPLRQQNDLIQQQSLIQSQHETHQEHDNIQRLPEAQRVGVDGNLMESINNEPRVPPSGRTCIVDGIYWTQDFLRLLPKGIEAHAADKWLKNVRNSQVSRLEEPQWNRCGRPKNGYAVLEDGSGVCARYRAPNTRLVQGEILSYWLARYLGFTTVPPVALSLVNSGQWSDVTDSVKKMEWDRDQFVALIMWLNNVDSTPQSKVYMPHPILNAIKSGVPLSLRRSHSDKNGCGRSSGLDLQNWKDSVLLKYLDKATSPSKKNRNVKVTMETLIQIAQWGNMIIFDYITANYDRVASMQDSADKEKQPSILAEPIRNLHRSKDTPLLWFLDNESGLLDAYELMYQGGSAGWRFHTFHMTMLQTMCIFDKQFINKIRDLYGFENPGVALEELAQEEEPSLSYIKPDNSHALFLTWFKSRLKDILDWVDECDSRLVY